MEYNKKIDGYRFEEKLTKVKDKNEWQYKITITYLCGSEEFIPPKTYTNVSPDKVQKIRDKLFDYVTYNFNEENISRCIPFFTIMGEVERIIYRPEEEQK